MHNLPTPKKLSTNRNQNPSRRRQLGCLLWKPKELIFTILVLSIEIEERIELKRELKRKLQERIGREN